MICLLRCLLLSVAISFSVSALAQTQETYKVKKKDTVYGIAHKYGISIDDLLKANPGAADADFNIKKGTVLVIPSPSSTASKTAPQSGLSKTTAAASKANGAINVGVMLPLHNNDGDGRRMVEYYRGLLMAFDRLKQDGINTNVFAWNVSNTTNVAGLFGDANLQKCDIIFGPLYTTQVKPLAAFCKERGTRLVIPFSIGGNDVETNPEIFQVYQPQATLTARAADAFMDRFKGRHVIFIDCNDSTSRKGAFTSLLRKKLEAAGMKYSITNLKSSEQYFSKAFSRTLPNVVVLNTGRSPELNVAFAKLNSLKATDPSVTVSMYGYTEWLMYTKVYLELFHKYDAYIPTTFFYNPLNSETAKVENEYRRWFRSDMQTALPRFALTGYDHGQFFLRGLKKYGKRFEGARWQNGYIPLQNQLKFVRAGAKGGMQNCGFMLVHYRTGGGAEAISY